MAQYRLPGPRSRQELTDYCLRKLGAPVIDIDVDPDQVEDRIDDALSFFSDYHFDASERLLLPHMLLQDDIDNQQILVPPNIISVVKVVPLQNTSNSLTMFDVRYQMRLNDLYTFTATSVVHYDTMMKHLALLEWEFNPERSIRFNRHKQVLPSANLVNQIQAFLGYRLVISGGIIGSISPGNYVVGSLSNAVAIVQSYTNSVISLTQVNPTNAFRPGETVQITTSNSNNVIGTGTVMSVIPAGTMYGPTGQKALFDPTDYQVPWGVLKCEWDWHQDVMVNQYVVVECYGLLDPDRSTDVYNDRFLKAYATALIKRQWGANLMKFQGVAMLGSVTLNGETIYSQADAEITKLEEEIQTKYELPVDFMMG